MADISTFILTFVVEAKGLAGDCGESLSDLGPPQNGIRLSYSLYPGYTYDLDILIWGHYAKIWHKSAFGWVRTWLQEGRTWLTFSMRHALRVETAVVREHVVSLAVTEGISALGLQSKSDKNFEVYCPTPNKLELSQFAEVIEGTAIYSNDSFLRELIWSLVVKHIPVSHLDGFFDIPQRVTDVRHRDAVLGAVHEEISASETLSPEVSLRTVESRQRSKRKVSEKQLAKGKTKQKGLEIHITGDAILSGVGRVTRGTVVGARRALKDTVAMLLSSCNLPAANQLPVFFVHPLRLKDMPVAEVNAAGFPRLYIRWKVLDFVHSSPAYPVSTNILLDDPQAIPLKPPLAAQLLAFFQEKFLDVEIRGLRAPVSDQKTAILFGTSPSDTIFGFTGMTPPRTPSKEMDVLVGICRIDLQTLYGRNAVIRESFPVFPPPTCLEGLKENPAGTNEINAIRAAKSFEQEFSASIILNAAPTLTLSVGYVGCRPVTTAGGFGRLLCAPTNVEATTNILDEIYRCNEITVNTVPYELLTGWAVDMGASAIIFVEGPCSGHVSSVWTKALQDQNSNSYFSTTARYTYRLYPELLETEPFLLLRLYATLSALLACPLLYVRPALPLPAREALLKLGRLAACGVDRVGPSDALPTVGELRSLALELAAPRRSHQEQLPPQNITR